MPPSEQNPSTASLDPEAPRTGGDSTRNEIDLTDDTDGGRAGGDSDGLSKLATIVPDRAQQEELRTLSRLGRKYLWAEPAVMQWLQRSGVNIEPPRFYSQLPTVDDIENSFEFDESHGPEGPYRQLFDRHHLERELLRLTPFAEEFEAPWQSADRSVFAWDNPAFSGLDAVMYWSAIRRHRPAKVVEIGSGYSSLIARDALRTNGGGELVLIEPFPMPWLSEAIPEATLIQSRAQDLDVEEFAGRFDDGDVLFIDSTHTVKPGSDCLNIYLRLLPAIERHVHVHVHDIHLPYAVPKARAHKRIHWAEQYLLAAYLIDNPRTTIDFGSAASHAWFRDATAALTERHPRHGGASLWFRQAPRG